uniref:Uncharacterized protein n=1 Tax=Anguilla anguilla TaxID=7936 RepID=A0A0E9QWQ7_ANGAN
MGRNRLRLCRPGLFVFLVQRDNATLAQSVVLDPSPSLRNLGETGAVQWKPEHNK